MKKKLTALPLCVTLIILSLSGCRSVSDSVNTAGQKLADRFHEWVMSDYQSPGSLAKSQAETVMDGIINLNPETLKSVLIPAMRAAPEIDTQIAALFDFIDGEIQSQTEASGYVSSENKREGKLTWQHLTGGVAEFITDAGSRYLLNLHAVNINADMPDQLGVYYIFVRNLDTMDYVIIGADIFLNQSLEDVLGYSLARELHAADSDGKILPDEFLDAWRWASYREWPLYMGYDENAVPVSYDFLDYNYDVLFTLTRFGNPDVIMIESNNKITTWRVTANPGDELPD